MLLLLLACGSAPDRTTSTHSNSLVDFTAKEAFLERYVTFDRTYEALAYTVEYRDNSGGLVPGPSDWDICIRAVVPEVELAAWTAGLSPTDRVGEDCGLGALPTNMQWYADGGVQVGVDPPTRTVHYRNVSR